MFRGTHETVWKWEMAILMSVILLVESLVYSKFYCSHLVTHIFLYHDCYILILEGLVRIRVTYLIYFENQFRKCEVILNPFMKLSRLLIFKPFPEYLLFTKELKMIKRNKVSPRKYVYFFYCGSYSKCIRIFWDSLYLIF